MKTLFLFLIFLFQAAYAHDKWIVVTTIQNPSPQLKKLAAIPGWRLVVVGDKKTPENWYLENCDYLSPQRQLELGYKLAQLLPWNHYSRKNIGYLYAIEHGAKVIYETDDDNEPVDGLNFFGCEAILPSVNTLDPCFNIYRYFDCPEIWPRGYPLSKIRAFSDFSLSSPYPCILGVEQGLVNQSPDVDAIFRLTQDRSLHFENHQPIFLPEGVYCPFNSQNTFFHPIAYFTLYLPSSVSMRVSDIWRGYISQKLLWNRGANLAFFGPNAVQERNEHSLPNDFSLELDLYLKASLLIDRLTNFKFSTSQQPLQEMLELYEYLVYEDFIQESELPLLKAWIEDLKKCESQR
jgi:hypothetical protein